MLTPTCIRECYLAAHFPRWRSPVVLMQFDHRFMAKQDGSLHFYIWSVIIWMGPCDGLEVSVLHGSLYEFMRKCTLAVSSSIPCYSALTKDNTRYGYLAYRILSQWTDFIVAFTRLERPWLLYVSGWYINLWTLSSFHFPLSFLSHNNGENHSQLPF